MSDKDRGKRLEKQHPCRLLLHTPPPSKPPPPPAASPSHRPAPPSLALHPPVIQYSSLSPTSRQTGHKTVCAIDGAGDMMLHPVWLTQHPPRRDKTSRLPIEPFCLRFSSLWWLKATFLLILKSKYLIAIVCIVLANRNPRPAVVRHSLKTLILATYVRISHLGCKRLQIERHVDMHMVV